MALISIMESHRDTPRNPPDVERVMSYIGLDNGVVLYMPTLWSLDDFREQFPWWIRWAIPQSALRRVSRFVASLIENTINSLWFLYEEKGKR